MFQITSKYTLISIVLGSFLLYSGPLFTDSKEGKYHTLLLPFLKLPKSPKIHLAPKEYKIWFVDSEHTKFNRKSFSKCQYKNCAIVGGSSKKNTLKDFDAIIIHGDLYKTDEVCILFIIKNCINHFEISVGQKSL